MYSLRKIDNNNNYITIILSIYLRKFFPSHCPHDHEWPLYAPRRESSPGPPACYVSVIRTKLWRYKIFYIKQRNKGKTENILLSFINFHLACFQVCLSRRYLCTFELFYSMRYLLMNF
uniref:Uncharacterized protein n=1 Tax=Cacopsylla melanoneura TaxID=428564 RepID=A0A8D9FCA0_9HEMI